MKDVFVHTRYGRVHCLEEGEGPAVFLFHTLGGSAYQFEETLPLLAKKYRAIAVDMIGHGDSDPLLRHMSMEEHSDAMMDVIDVLCDEAPIIFGQSVGGYMVADMALRYPEQIKRTIIGEAPPRVEENYAATWLGSEKGWTQPTNTADEIKARFREMTPELLDRWNIDRNKAGAKAMMDIYWAIRDFDYLGCLKKMDDNMDAEIVVGERSVAAGPLFGRYKELGLDKKFPIIVMKDVGHFISIDDSQQLVDIIDR